MINPLEVMALFIILIWALAVWGINSQVEQEEKDKTEDDSPAMAELPDLEGSQGHEACIAPVPMKSRGIDSGGDAHKPMKDLEATHGRAIQRR